MKQLSADYLKSKEGKSLQEEASELKILLDSNDMWERQEHIKNLRKLTKTNGGN